MVVLPSVKSTMIFWALEPGSNSSPALVKASAWLVEPAAVRLSTAAFRAATEVISWVSFVAVLAKLTTAIRLPPPICPSWLPPVDSARISIKVLAPAFMLARGAPAILLDRSRTRTTSAGWS